MPLELSPFLRAYLYILAALLGLVFGSFCNAWAWRLVHHESIARGRSHCACCGHTLAALDLIPLFSWLFLRGRCRWCGEKISPRYPLMELLCALLFLSLIWRLGLSWALLRFLLLGCLLLVLSLVDWDAGLLPNGLVAAAALLSLLRLIPEGPSGLWDALLGAAVAIPMLLLVLLFDRIKGQETMGGGDIKLLAALGLHFGLARTLFLLILACILGLLLVALRRAGTKRAVPFGPALSAAAWLTALFGQAFVDWYLALFF